MFGLAVCPKIITYHHFYSCTVFSRLSPGASAKKSIKDLKRRSAVPKLNYFSALWRRYKTPCDVLHKSRGTCKPGLLPLSGAGSDIGTYGHLRDVGSRDQQCELRFEELGPDEGRWSQCDIITSPRAGVLLDRRPESNCLPLSTIDRGSLADCAARNGSPPPFLTPRSNPILAEQIMGANSAGSESFRACSPPPSALAILPRNRQYHRRPSRAVHWP